MIPVKSKKYDFDITVSPNTYAGELALPYVTAAILGAETINKGRARLIEGVVHKAVINPLNYDGGLLQAAGCDFADGASMTLAEQVVTLNDLMVNEAICRGTIFPTFMAAQGRMVRDGQIPPAFTEFLLASTAEQAGKSLETLMWAGDSGIFGDRNPKPSRRIVASPISISLSFPPVSQGEYHIMVLSPTLAKACPCDRAILSHSPSPPREITL